MLHRVLRVPAGGPFKTQPAFSPVYVIDTARSLIGQKKLGRLGSGCVSISFVTCFVPVITTVIVPVITTVIRTAGFVLKRTLQAAASSLQKIHREHHTSPYAITCTYRTIKSISVFYMLILTSLSSLCISCLARSYKNTAPALQPTARKFSAASIEVQSIA